jgi:putative MATE family efflux protein
MDRSKELGNVWKLLVKFSIPAVIGMLVNALYSVVDRIFVGQGVGSIALSGVAVTFPITNIIMAVGMLVGIGSAAVVSIKLGQKKPEEAEHILGNAFVLSVLITVIISILGLVFLEPLLVMFGASAETMPYARQFAAILLAGAVLQNIGFGINPIIRSQGDPKTAMKTMLIGAALNFALNPLFIFGFKLGVAGSAYATLISQAVCTIWIFAYFTRGKSLLKLKKANMKLQKHIVSQILAIGVSPFAMQVAASMVTICINTNLARYGGDLAIGAYSLIMSIAILILMPAFGVNQGAQPIIGYNFGSGQLDRVKKALKYSMVVNTVIATAGFLVVQLFPVQIISMFNSTDAQLIAIGSEGITMYLMMFALVGPSSAIINYFQSVGKAKHSMGLSLSRQVIILIPLVFILPHFFQLDGIWMAGAVSDLVSSLICFAFIAKEAKLLNGNDEKIQDNRTAACNIQC